MSEAPLQRLEAELGDVRIVLALRALNEGGTHESSEINCCWHLYSSLVLPGCRPVTPCPAPNARQARTEVRAPTLSWCAVRGARFAISNALKLFPRTTHRGPPTDTTLFAFSAACTRYAGSASRRGSI